MNESSIRSRSRGLRRFRTAISCVATAFALSAVPASAQLIITPTFDSSITSDPNAATIIATLNQAIAFYETTFSDPINVTIKFQEMGSGLGESSTAIYLMNYATVRTAMGLDGTSANDATALANTPVGPNNPVDGGTSIVVTTANIRALGISGFPPGSFDGVISLNTSLMNLDRVTVNPAKYDLLAVAEHEIDEVLGLGSGLNLPSDFFHPRMEDLFRYTSGGTRTFTSAGDNAYFSIDGGVTDLARFNQSAGADYGDWWSTGAHTPQVQDAFGAPGSTPNMGAEVTALDVIGYTLKATPPPAAVPEPSTYGAMGAIALFGAIALRRRASRSRVH